MAESRLVLPRRRWTADATEVGDRLVAEETAVAIVHDASTTAVLMATPADLVDLAVGFSLTEGLIDAPEDIRSVDIVPGADGIEARVWLTSDQGARLAARRRRMAGPTGCGLCGVESLAEAIRPPKKVGAGLRVSPQALLDAMAALPDRQALGRATRAAHAAALWSPDLGLIAVREDVGRHNALDKLAGAVWADRVAANGVILLTSRVSVEMVQKAASLGAQIVCAVSAPTALAVRTAHAAGLTLVAIARADGFEVFTGDDRIEGW